MAKNATHFEYDGFAAIDEKLKSLSLDSPELKQRIQKIVWEVLGAVRRAAMNAGQSSFRDSKHGSINAIRRSVWKKIIGGAVGIASGRRGSIGSGASSRTERINSYRGADRGFILRFVNSGTRERFADGRNARMTNDELSARRGQRGYRGAITSGSPGYGFFTSSAKGAIQNAADKLAELIDNEINKQINNG